MKLRMIKKITAVVLVAALALIPVLPAFAAEQSGQIPCILIRGFMSSTIYAEKGNPDSKQVWPPVAKDIVPAVFKLLPPLMNLLVTKNYDRFADKGFPVLNDLFSGAFLDVSGEAANGSGVVPDYPSEDRIKSGEQLEFQYDWRLDPIAVAPELDKYINYVTEKAGSDKVCIECRSFGGVIALTYAGIYGTDKIKSIVFNASAVYGAGFSGELFEGKMHFDDEALTEFLKAAFAYNKNEKLLNGIFAVLKKTGFTGKLCGLLNGLVDGCGERLLKECLFPFLGVWPSTWAMISSDYYDDSFDFIFNKVFAGDDSVTALKTKVIDFDTRIRKNRENILADINENCGLYVISKHGFCSMFMTPAWGVEGDMVLESEDTSFGAKFAPYGSSAPASGAGEADAKYVSPDKRINASTCLYPEQTWFISNLTHTKVFDSTHEFTMALLYYDGQATVDTMAGYSRFMHYDEASGKLVSA